MYPYVCPCGMNPAKDASKRMCEGFFVCLFFLRVRARVLCVFIVRYFGRKLIKRRMRKLVSAPQWTNNVQD